MIRLSAIVSAVTIGLLGCWTSVGSARSANDPPTIVGWHKIGRVDLGMLRDAVEYRYGATVQSGGYRVSSGELLVGYSHGRVSQIWTDSPHYRSEDNVGVGSYIPLGRCIRASAGKCSYRWREFTYRPPSSQGLSGDWEAEKCHGGIPTSVSLEVDQGYVKSVSVRFGGGSGGGCGLPPSKPLTVSERAAVVAVVKELVSRETNDSVYVYRVSGYRLPRSSRSYTVVGVSIRDVKTHAENQGFAAVLRRSGSSWVVAESGTDFIGCFTVPLRVLAELGLACATQSGPGS